MNTPVRRIPAVAPTVQPVPAARMPGPARMAPRSAATPAASPVGEWENAERGQEAMLRGVGNAVLPVRQGGEGDGQAKDPHGPLVGLGHTASPAGAAGAGGDSDPQQELPASLARLGGLIVAFAVHASAHGGWAAHVPLSGDLLVATTLHLSCEHGVLTLRFETTEWDSRDLVARHAQSLMLRLRCALPTLSAVELTV